MGADAKASAFERKCARKRLENELQNLKYKTATEKRVKKSMARVDMKARVMKESKVKLSYCPKNLSQAVKKVLNIRMKMADVFLKEKDARHLEEDPSILLTSGRL